ncbi:MAG TPA: phosphodiesterase [Candidatus Methylomirabilis sp.]|nr:phosphodiesterase [Candidatus Methylomirabilis sp.]
MLIAQISDMHIKAPGRLAYRRVETAGYLARCVDRLGKHRPRPDAVLATGDLVDGGRPEEYRRLRELLEPLPMPVYLIPGNHDARDALAAEFALHSYLPRRGTFLHYVIDRHPVRLIGLDTLVPGQGGGLMCDERLGWLGARLEEARDRPTVIFMHHPPFATGIRRMDAQGLDNAEAMAEVVRAHPQVERVVCGHVHRSIHVRWAGTVASIAPSTAHQVSLDLEGDTLTFGMEPPAYQLHLWHAGRGLVTHTVHVGDYEGPYPFYEGGKLIE